MKQLTILQHKLQKSSLDFFLIESSANLRYLTDFTGSSGTVIIPASDQPILLVDSRYTLQAFEQAKGLQVIEYENLFRDFWVEFVKKNLGKNIGFESSYLSHERLIRFRHESPGLRWVPTKNLVEQFRSVKTADEVSKLSQALAISDQAFKSILKIIKPGMTEKEITWKLEVLMREGGAEKLAWEPQIVGAGKNSALPHHGSGPTVVRQGDQVQLDFGCVFDGFHTDTSRVVFLGKPTAKQIEIYKLVLEAQELGISLVKPGVEVGEIDRQVKDWLKTKTDGVYKHGLGHGVGLEIHEKPTLYNGVKDKLEVGNVITIEPGVYIEGWGGVRLEDMVLVTETGHQVLTKAPKDTKQIII